MYCTLNPVQWTELNRNQRRKHFTLASMYGVSWKPFYSLKYIHGSYIKQETRTITITMRTVYGGSFIFSIWFQIRKV